jgi:ubiquitin-conjugating enzyme E2 Z
MKCVFVKMIGKRLLKEHKILTKWNDPDFCVDLSSKDMTNVTAYIAAPKDSVYEGTFVKVNIQLTDKYPFEPPKVKFLHFSLSGARLHPNLYDNGKVCLSILGTWSGEPWTSVMNIQYILRVIQSLLDASPMKHEPNRGDSPQYNEFVRYFSLQYLLLDYLNNETNIKFKTFLQNRSRKDLEFLRSIKHCNKGLECSYTHKVYQVNSKILVDKVELAVSNY